MKRVNNKDKDNILTEMTKKNNKEEEGGQQITLTKDQILQMVRDKTYTIRLPTSTRPSPMHPTAAQRKDLKNVSKEQFTRYVRKCGSSAHIGVSRHWVNKYVRVTMEEVPEQT